MKNQGQTYQTKQYPQGGKPTMQELGVSVIDNLTNM